MKSHSVLIHSWALTATSTLAGLGATFIIVWAFGLAEFAEYLINLAKLSLILLGAELLPSSFAIFRLQDDPRFSQAAPVFYLLFALTAASFTTALLLSGVLDHYSWFMVLFVFTSAIQRYFDTLAQAAGRVDAFFWIPAASNSVRLLLLASLSFVSNLATVDILWASVALGSLTGQAVMACRFPEFFNRRAYTEPINKLTYLFAIRREYYAYYANSVLKRLRDTFLPLFADLAIPSKTEIGRLLVFTRANEAVCGQLRVLEAFMVNRTIRKDLRWARRQIIVFIAPFGQLAVAVLALLLMARHGISGTDVLLALLTGAFVFPYVLELLWRNDALAAFEPKQVTISLVAFLTVLSAPPLTAWAFGQLGISVMLLSYVAAQTAASLTYRLFRSDPSPSGKALK